MQKAKVSNCSLTNQHPKPPNARSLENTGAGQTGLSRPDLTTLMDQV